MVNTQYLDNKIAKSGYKVNYITDQLGISRQAFTQKKNNIHKFRAAEIYVLCDLLNIKNEEKADIFFAEKVN